MRNDEESRKVLSASEEVASDKELTSEKLDLSDMEEVAGGAELSKLTGNGCGICCGQCGGKESEAQRIFEAKK